MSTALRFWAGSLVPIPWIAPDELIYGELGKSLYATGRLELLGQPTRFFSLVTPALAGLPLSLGDLDLGYKLLKALQALVMSLAAVPVYLWTRDLTTRGWALVAAALTLAVPGLAYSGLIMTEVALYPLLVLAAWSMARTLLRPTAASQLLTVGAILLACATRLQMVVLAPAFVAAAAATRRPRELLRFWPAAAALAAVGAAWAAWQLRHGGPASQVLGAYRAAGEVNYGAGDAIRYVAYHAADVFLFTGVFPVCAVAALFLARPKPAPLRAYLAVTGAVVLVEVAAVGVFASRHVGHLAERNLFSVAPLFFVGFAAWLGLGAPRPRLATPLVGIAAFVLVVLLPVKDFVTRATIPDSFTLIPLYRLGVHAPGTNLGLVLDAIAAAAVAAFVLVPRRAINVLPLALFVALATASVSASRVVAGEATLTKPGTVGLDPRWVDRAARGPAVYLYTGDVYWNSVWETVFWNRRVRRVYDLLEAEVPGGIPQDSVGPEEDGRLVLKTGAEVPARYVVASDSLRFVGERVADAGNSIDLWRLRPPFRLAQWIQNVRFDGTVEQHARVVVYACRGGALRLRLTATTRTAVELRRNDRLYRRRSLGAGERWAIDVPAAAPRPLGRRLCSFDLLVSRPVKTSLVRFIDLGKRKS